MNRRQEDATILASWLDPELGGAILAMAAKHDDWPEMLEQIVMETLEA